MKFAKPLVLPGAGIRTWLVLVAGVATITGIMLSMNLFVILLLVLLFAACFAVLSLWPMVAAICVSLRYAGQGQRQTAAAYALVPVAAIVIAALCGWTGFRVTEWTGHSFHKSLGRQEETARLEELERSSSYRTDWLFGHWPPPDTPVRINSPFGSYTIPLQNLGSRDEFLLNPLEPKEFSIPRPDGSFDWNSFSLSFWMPDGAGVLTNAPRLLTSGYVDPVDRKWHRSPMRPREVGRPNPSPTRYTVVVGEFCPGVLPQPLSHFQGSSLAFQGYGYGALYMWGCAVDKPDPDWRPIDVHGPGNTEIFCRVSEDICFGWIDLIDEGVRALTYLPRDAATQTPDIATRMHALLQRWKTLD